VLVYRNGRSGRSQDERNNGRNWNARKEMMGWPSEDEMRELGMPQRAIEGEIIYLDPMSALLGLPTVYLIGRKNKLFHPNQIDVVFVKKDSVEDDKQIVLRKMREEEKRSKQEAKRVKNAIIGKWKRYDYDPKSKGRIALEFTKDTAVFRYGSGPSSSWDYFWLSNSRIRFNQQFDIRKIPVPGVFPIKPLSAEYEVSVSSDELVLTMPGGKVEKYKRVSSFAGLAGYVAEFNKLDYLLRDVNVKVLECPRESCNDYEEEAAKVLISHLLTRKSGKWFTRFVASQVIKSWILSGLVDELTQMLISLGEVGTEKIIREVKDKFSHGADIKTFSLEWRDIGVLPIYLPYENRDGPYGKADGEALMVFYSPNSISVKEIKEQVKRRGGTFYLPPLGLREKAAKLPDNGIVRPFRLIIRGTVRELGEVIRYERGRDY